MESVWITTAEVGVEPGDMPSGDVVGFMKITSWATSEEAFIEKIRMYLSKYNWVLISVERTELADPSHDYGDETNQLIDETLRNKERIGLGTYYSYKLN
jgi:hypothetical protein